MDNVDWAVSMFCNSDDSMNSLSFNRLWSRKIVSLWSSDSFIKEFLLVDFNDISIFSMDDANSTEISSTLEGSIHGKIINSKYIIVGHEELEAGNTILNHSFHLAWRFSIPINYG